MALEVWRRSPGIIVVTAVFGAVVCAPVDHAAYLLVLFPVSLFFVGFMGTQRLWYVRTSDGDVMTGREVWRSSWAYSWRFAVLGLLMGLAMTPVLLLGASGGGWAVHAAGIAVVALQDVVLSFVTPALTVTTSSVRKAWGIGWSFLTRDFSRLRWHFLAPPLAVMFAAQTLPALSETVWAAAAVSAFGALLNLLFKGAQVFAYVEHAGNHIEAGRSRGRRAFERSGIPRGKGELRSPPSRQS
ncbi:MAG TPA: hypothetical protein VM618_01885 [Acidimicrobiia bacterium]|nr:hypothetical protein [Acidimicrobiia bacterium]